MNNSPLTEILESDLIDFEKYYSNHLPQMSITEYKNALNFFIAYVSRIEGIKEYKELTKGMLNSKYKAFMKKYNFDNLKDVHMKRSLRDFFWFIQEIQKKDIGKTLGYIG